ncbi:uncharacterized protein LOC133904571 [Phragmites australis]|uniref:uncharacterized protein LOC133904571 n=1 Tax=Phragmites australis TaxID=29695 RepID=UPI002D78A5AB|nr:uncharacterized protein LOC133904571 [Phragmites australis]
MPYSSDVRSQSAKNTDDISGAFSGMNSLPNSSKESTEYNQLELQKKIIGNKKIGFGSGLNRDDGGCSATVGGPLARLHGPAKQRMVKALSAQPYYPVFPASQDASSSSSSQQTKVVNQMLAFPEHHQGIYPAHPSLQSSIEGNTTFMALHFEEPHYQENVSLTDGPSILGMNRGGDSNLDINKDYTVGVSNDMPRMDLQDETVTGKTDFDQMNCQRSIDHRENTAFHSLGTNSEFSRAPTFLHQRSSEFTQLNSPAIKGSASSGSSLIRPGPQPSGYSPCPTLPPRVAAHGSAVSATSQQPQVIKPSYQENVDFAELSSQGVDEMGLGRAENPGMLIAQKLHKIDGNSMTLQAMILRDKKGRSFRRGSSEDVLKMMWFHEMCIRALFDDIPAIIMDRLAQMKDFCSGVTMGMERSRSPNHSAAAVSSPTISGTPSYYALKIYSHAKKLYLCPMMVKLLLLVVFCSIDQFGSRFIQEKIATATPEEKDMVFIEIIPRVAELVTDAFANYVIQKLMEHGAPSHRSIIAEFLVGNVLRLSCHKHGCRVIQRAIEFGDLDQKIRIAKELDGNILRCIDDQNANHVVQKCIEHVPRQHIKFIFKSMYGRVVDLSAHPYGCRVIQGILEHCDDPSIQKVILSEIMEQVYWLAKDKYGNYIVQHLLQHGIPPLQSAIIRIFAGRVMSMSQGKFSSNVIEKCLMHGNYEEKQMIINEVLGSGGGTDALVVMVDDPYANYVVQKVIETCEDWQRGMILGRLRTHLREMSHHTYGRHVVARVEKLIRAGGRLPDSSGELETGLLRPEQRKFRPVPTMAYKNQEAMLWMLFTTKDGEEVEVPEPDWWEIQGHCNSRTDYVLTPHSLSVNLGHLSSHV